MLRSLALASSAKNRAADAPVIPEPTMTISADGGRFGVVRCPRRNSDGSLCQNEAVDFSEGRPAILSIKLEMREASLYISSMLLLRRYGQES